MKISKDNILNEDKDLAIKLLSGIKNDKRVFGNPAYGLKITLRELDDKHQKKLSQKSKVDFDIGDKEYKAQAAMLRAGIYGEEVLAEYFEKIIKYDRELQDIIVFASLSDESQVHEDLDYIPDSDFIAIYGRHILVLDAKNINTSPEIPVYMDGNSLMAAGGQEIMHFNPSTHIWRNILQGEKIDSIKGCTVIVNKMGAAIWRNADWHKSDVQPLHITELVEYLHGWIEGKRANVDLRLLTKVSKMQIKKEKSSLDLSQAAKLFKL